MSDEKTIPIHPITASESGKNAVTLHCKETGQSMAYCACLNRLKKLDAGDRVPADWGACGKAKSYRLCAASIMRDEELLQGRSIYFAAREAFQGAVATARKWIADITQLPAAPAPAPAGPARRSKRSADALDALGDLAGYGDALSAAASAPAPVAAPPAPRAAEPEPTPVPAPTLVAGESPLAMARRLAAARKSNPST